jgi:hypothetical protein
MRTALLRLLHIEWSLLFTDVSGQSIGPINPDERSSQLLRSGSLKSRFCRKIFPPLVCFNAANAILILIFASLFFWGGGGWGNNLRLLSLCEMLIGFTNSIQKYQFS